MTRTGLVLGLAMAAAFVAPAVADCGQDMQKLAQARNAEIQKLNDFFKAYKGKPADPEAACARTSGILRADEALIAYMTKNKDWCSFPDEALANLKAGHAKNVAFSGRACSAAAQLRKMKEQAAKGESGGGPQAQPLPTGPL